MALWANLHGGYLLGLALVAPFAAEAVAAAADRAAALRAWGLFAAASLAAALLTPFGLSGLAYPLQVMGMHGLPLIAEWRPADFSRTGPLEIALLASLFVMLSRGVRIPPWRLLLLLALMHLALHQTRQQIVLALAAAMLLAEPLGEALGAGPRPEPALGARRAVAALGLAAALLLAGLRAALPVVRGDGLTSPASALAQVPPQLATRPVFNSYGFGGYLIWRGVRPFIDGRGDMYGDAFLEPAVDAERGDPAALAAILTRWNVAWTLLSPGDAANAVLDRTPGWRRTYADRYAVVHVREAPAR
jgi:hypothetical protein